MNCVGLYANVGSVGLEQVMIVYPVNPALQLNE